LVLSELNFIEESVAEANRPLSRFPGEVTGGAVKTVREGVRSRVNSLYRKVASLRSRVKAAKKALVKETTIRAARILIATIGQAAAFAIFRSVLVVVRNKLVVRVGDRKSAFDQRFTTSTLEMVIAMCITLFSSYRNTAFEILLGKSALQAKNSKTIQLMIDTVVDRIGEPCINAVNEPLFVLTVTIEFCDAFIELVDRSCLRNPRVQVELKKGAYPVIATALVQSAAASRSLWVPIMVKKLTKTSGFKWLSSRDANIDKALSAFGIEGRDKIGDALNKMVMTVLDVLNENPVKLNGVKFNDVTDEAIQEGEEALEAEIEQTTEEVSSRERDEEDNEDEKFWDADDFFVTEEGDVALAVKIEDLD
jgi:hypothetical protein